MKSDTEELCKTSFDKYLKELCPTPFVLWREVSMQDEPPDYYVSIDGAAYAVEVTTLIESVAIGPVSLPLAAVRRSLRAFTDEVRKTAQQGGFLHGTYLVGFMRPIENFSRKQDQMRTALLDYIRQTQHLSEAPAEEILKRRGLQRCWVHKVHDLADSVVMGGPTGSKSEGEAAKQICTLLEERLRDKLHKLRELQGPRILLLHDRYLFADSAMLRECIPRLPSLGHFHTVFIAGGTIGKVVLYSQNPDWL